MLQRVFVVRLNDPLFIVGQEIALKSPKDSITPGSKGTSWSNKAQGYVDILALDVVIVGLFAQFSQISGAAEQPIRFLRAGMKHLDGQWLVPIYLAKMLNSNVVHLRLKDFFKHQVSNACKH